MYTTIHYNQPYPPHNPPQNLAGAYCPLESNDKSKIAGPATVTPSSTPVLEFVTTTYTVPSRPSGIVTVRSSSSGTSVAFWPFRNPAYSVVVVGLLVEVPVVRAGEESSRVVPGREGPSMVSAREGKACTGREGLEEGQEVMKEEARV